MNIRHLILCGLAALAVTAAGCGGGDTETATFSVDAPPLEEGAATEDSPAAERGEKPKVVIPSGPPPKELETRDIKEGTGPAAKEGDSIQVDYVGKAYSTGKEFDTSFRAGGQPFPLVLGQGGVIAGWDEGIVGMKVGGRRELIIPPDKAYGARGFPPDIKADETLVFVVDLVDIE